ncbi:interleukin-15 receptor subunit alpha [Phaenicophaeus curvirostris]|uniref:interleukin-15 receptor subunit alpha n=1 Tax=Phaenicophaeus curvirostris TaxID=33595 RepID=UPI0037F09C1C
MERPPLPLLCAALALLLPGANADTARCSHPKAVPNAHIDVGNNTLLNTSLRYACNPGFKRKAGTSSLIQCIVYPGSTKPQWTDTTLQCIRDPALPPVTPSPELPKAPHTTRTTQRAGTADGSPSSIPSPAPMPKVPETASRSLLPPVSSPETTSTLLEMTPPLETSTLGEGTTPLPPDPIDHAAVSIQTVASSLGLLLVVVAGVVACCCWRMKMHARQDSAVTTIPMVASATENEEMLPPNDSPTG